MLKVLVVEDSEFFIEELCEEVFNTLERRDEIVFAQDGQRARKELESFHPDLIIVDMIFPSRPGGEADDRAGEKLVSFARELLPQSKIVALSSREGDFAIRLLLSGEIEDYLIKSLPWPEIRARLQAHIEAAEGLKNKRLEAFAQPEFLVKNELVSQSEKFSSCLEAAKRVAQRDSTVLLTGETGSGKEVLARFIHERSERRSNPFIAVNCGVLSEELGGSELFGHVEGAFTGARDSRAGCFELAHGGSLFLDEIAEVSSSVQVMLLRALETRSVTPLGSNKGINCDLRLIAATNRELRQLVDRGEFRSDLYYRLAVFQIPLPPLRERREDIIPLIDFFGEKMAQSFGRKYLGLSDGGRRWALSYDWPGNVRELRNVLERSLILEEGPCYDLEHARESVKREDSSSLDYQGALEQFERELLSRAMCRTSGDTALAAEELGLARRTLQKYLKRLKLDPKSFKN